MAIKKTRILKKDWPTFIKDFNLQNQFRRAYLLVGEEPVVSEPGLPLAGLAYEPEARKIEIYFGKDDPHALTHMAHVVDIPRALYLIRDEDALNPVVGLQIQAAPGTPMVYIYFADENPYEVRAQWTSSLAYALFLERGQEHGADQHDWYNAERLIEKALAPFIENE